jgi:hypothetical protein
MYDVSFRVEEIYDEELKGWTISIPVIDLYGEGNTKEEAISDLVGSIKEYITLYKESDSLAKHESPEKQAAISKLIHCKISTPILAESMVIFKAKRGFNLGSVKIG